MSITTYTSDEQPPSRGRLSPEQGAHLEQLQFRFRSGRLCLDFVATAGGRKSYGFYERLRHCDDLGLWLFAAGLFVVPPMVAEDELEAALLLRRSIYALTAPETASSRRRRNVDELNRWGREPPLVPQLHLSAGRLETRVEGDIPAALATIARDAIDLLSGAMARRIRECSADGCILLFVDTSRPGKRRWCSTNACGSVANASAYRQRRAAAKTEADSKATGLPPS